MVRNALCCGLLLWGSCLAAPPSAVGAAVGAAVGDRPGAGHAAGKSRRLTGRFLHITDFHPDPYYKTYSSTTAEAACHRHRGPAGVYGAETSACDSPCSLINQTFDWIEKNIKDDVDFVIWTGDSARHDNDEAIPRTQKQIIQQNQYMVDKFLDVFGQDEDKNGRVDQLAIPIVPTFGNNDIMPHNIFLSGPNRWTMKYLGLWRKFIPEAQRHQFSRGGWFSVEVIPGKLAVISLNTMYFFTSNSGVDGCAKKREPGYEHMEWLRIQLQIFRERNMKAILMGHVPPARVDSKESWDETCWQKYTLWTRQFRDIIVGSLYGHMNIDHFMLQDFEQISKDAEKGRMAASMEQVGALQEEGAISLYEDGEVTVASASDYLLDLRNVWSQLPAPRSQENRKSPLAWFYGMFAKPKKGGVGGRKKYLEKIGGRFAQRYGVSLVAPSVVPNYFPTLRIIEYNITGLEKLDVSSQNIQRPSSNNSSLSSLETSSEDDDEAYLAGVETALRGKKHKKKKKKGSRKYKFKVPLGPSPSSPPGPAYSAQSLTWTRYIQYYANLTRINNDFDGTEPVDPNHRPHNHQPQQVLYSPNQGSPQHVFGLAISEKDGIEAKRWKEGKHHQHQGKQPRHEPHPTEFYYEVEYDTKKDRGFKDLTVRRWVEYASRIGGTKAASTTTESEQYVVEASGNKHKHGKGKKSHGKASKEWFTFVKRAFVGTMDPRQIKQVFGSGADGEGDMHGVDESMEL